MLVTRTQVAMVGHRFVKWVAVVGESVLETTDFAISFLDISQGHCILAHLQNSSNFGFARDITDGTRIRATQLSQPGSTTNG